MIWNPLRDLVARHSDVDRPLRLAEVVDNSRWSAVGDSWISCLIAGSRREAIYRDGPQPAIGSRVQVVQTGPGTSAPWLALPLPGGCAGLVYVSLRRVAGASSASLIVRLDLQGGAATVLGPHPAGGGPLTSAGGRYLLAWADGGALYRSADGGASWAGPLLTGVRDVTSAARNGRLFALTDGALYRSTDYGATWAAEGATLPGTGIAVAQDLTGGIGLGYTAVSLVTSAGLCVWFPESGHLDGPFTPAPAGGGGVARSGAGTLYWPGGGDVYFLADGVVESNPGGLALTSSYDWFFDGVHAPYALPFAPTGYAGGGAGRLSDWGGFIETVGAGAAFAIASHDPGTPYYDGAQGAARAVALVSANPPDQQPIGLYGAIHDCRLVALDTEDGAGPTLLLKDFTGATPGATAWQALPTAFDGGQYVVAERGLATLEVWRLVEQ